MSFSHYSTPASNLLSDVRSGPDQFLFSLEKHVDPETLATTCETLKKLCAHPENISIISNSRLMAALSNIIQTNAAHVRSSMFHMRLLLLLFFFLTR